MFYTMTFNPAASLLFWFAFVAACAPCDGLILIFSCLTLLIVAAILARKHLVRLIRRSLWLIFTLVIVLVCLTPGVPFPVFSFASREGLALAATQTAHLLLVLASLALLFNYLSPTQLVAGLHTLFSSLRRFGFPVDRMAVRLMLTLTSIEQTPVIKPTVNAVGCPAGEVPDAIALPVIGWKASDFVLVTAAVALITTIFIS